MDNTDTAYETEGVAPQIEPVKHTDWFGVVLGALIFLFGIGLLVFTFLEAAKMFAIPAKDALGAKKDITEIGVSFGHVLLRIGLLLVMSIVGSIVSGKGIRMYLAARARTPIDHR
ncbi:MAG: hypothetical protein H0W86_00725 [Armatimonadetes bacterium]|nr:hypothetical protein [Armatimonadota bacterium]